jgi:hypothetical protein
MCGRKEGVLLAWSNALIVTVRLRGAAAGGRNRLNLLCTMLVLYDMLDRCRDGSRRRG